MEAKALKRVLPLIALLASSACAVKTVDCSLLSDQEIADAHRNGQCGNVFARTHDEVIPVGSVVPPQRRKARPPNAQLLDDPGPAVIQAEAEKRAKTATRPPRTQSAQNFP
ncbi:hypothetical protein [Azospirillum rugosum]|uniref:Secreted protein n=1 Tax=Azospirillum rugosum TaxID=416170 RepID=A0ABS4SDB3_9PROT|nr:hypothetical protein [Azospirillum rugosum]MBP2290561.1 hypothetical protein [Azospirillum rugosum]MDQ0525449.1 hypothetical protein [Azospirillum rugosum]